MGYNWSLDCTLKGDEVILYTLYPKWYKGPKGVACYMSYADKEGYYDVYFFRPSGPGALKGKAKEFKRVHRLDTHRKTKGKAMDRAYVLAYGKSRHKLKPRQLVKSNPGMTAFCLKQKKHVLVKQWDEGITKNGRAILTGKCPECATKVSKLGKLIDCPECGERRPGKTGDYICIPCRQSM